MVPTRVMAISTDLAEAVREMQKDPHYKFPAYADISKGDAPCRHCLKIIPAGEQALLFTYDAFEGVEKLPLPGPVYIHAWSCERYPEDAGFPAELKNSPRTLNAYATGRKLLAQEYVGNGTVDSAIEKLFERSDVHYIHVRSTTVGCYTFRIERQDQPENTLAQGTK
ncbi:MAG: DUF1203 domain-containing protein [Candidatus Acidiferrales bacterium]|jgi:hypothetical protein